MGTAFTYQGRLNDGGAPATGWYDFNFKLYDALTDGHLLNPPDGLFIAGVGITNGLFTVSLPFGSGGCLLEYADALSEATVWHALSPQPTGHSYTTPATATQQ